MEKKVPYEKPALHHLEEGGEGAAAGLCANGSQASGTCQPTGAAAAAFCQTGSVGEAMPPGLCSNGSQAVGSCGSGSQASSSCQPTGAVAAAFCQMGSAPAG